MVLFLVKLHIYTLNVSLKKQYCRCFPLYFGRFSKTVNLWGTCERLLLALWPTSKVLKNFYRTIRNFGWDYVVKRLTNQIIGWFSSEVYSELNQTSKMEPFRETVNRWKLLTIFENSSKSHLLTEFWIRLWSYWTHFETFEKGVFKL